MHSHKRYEANISVQYLLYVLYKEGIKCLLKWITLFLILLHLDHSLFTLHNDDTIDFNTWYDVTFIMGPWSHINSSSRDCDISSSPVMDIPQSCARPSICGILNTNTDRYSFYNELLVTLCIYIYIYICIYIYIYYGCKKGKVAFIYPSFTKGTLKPSRRLSHETVIYAIFQKRTLTHWGRRIYASLN